MSFSYLHLFGGPSTSASSDVERPTLLDVVGFGRYSRVLRAYTGDASEPAYIAVKRIPKTVDASHEVANHAKVSDHAHILSFLGSYEDPNAVFLKLDLANGTLISAIMERNLFQGNPVLVRTALLQLIDAVHYCHEQGVFHGDVKPANIFYKGDSDNFKLLLGDFGASSNTPKASVDGALGSEMYASPERLGEELTMAQYSLKHSDIWSIGIVAVNIICAHIPWERAASSSSNFNRFLFDPNYLRSLGDISKDCQSVLKRILDMNPMARISLPNLRAEFATLPAFYEDLTQDSPHQYTARNSPAQLYYSKLSAIPQICMPASSQASTCSKNSVDSERIIYPSPALAFEPLMQHDPLPMVERIAKSLSSCDGCSSDEESDGPITPYSAPVEVDIEVPELDLRDGGFLAPPKQVKGRFRSSSWAGKLLKHKTNDQPRAVSVMVKVSKTTRAGLEV